MMTFEPGTFAGDYEILEVIGKGGMGRVYRVRNKLSNRIEAMKVLLSDLTSDPTLGERFLAEIRTVARLDHPNIARLHTAFQVENQLLMIMEFVEGVSLSDAAKLRTLPLDSILNYTTQILSALAYAHKNGVIHRDIKPSNIMVTPNGVAKLMDFGIAKSAADPLKTSPGTTMGSIPYMSPEQIRGSDVDARSDLYSFGILLYELTAGRVPFQSETMFEILDGHLNNAPRPPIELNPAVPPALNEVVLTALQKDPAKRFANAEAFRNALESVRREAVVDDSDLAPTVVAMPATEPAVPVPAELPRPAVSPAPAVAASAPTRGNRTLWMTAGALACVCVLIAAAVVLPGLFKQSAASGSDTRKQATPQATTASAENTKTPQPSVVPTAGQPEASAPSASSTMSKPNGSVSSENSRRDTLPSLAMNRTPRPASREPQPQTPAQNDASTTASAAPVQAAPAPAIPAGPSQAELDGAEEELMKLHSRAEAVNSSLNNLRSQQAASGLGIRQDIAAAASRMDSYLQASDRALQGKNLEGAKKFLASADSEISKLESFFGR